MRKLLIFGAAARYVVPDYPLTRLQSYPKSVQDAIVRSDVEQK